MKVIHFRIQGALDLDRNIDVRHAESNVQAICYEDMRLGPDRPFIFTPNNQTDTVLVTPKHGLTIPLGPVKIEHAGIEHSLSIGEVMSLDSDYQIKSSHDLVGIQMKGDSGVALIPPSKASPSTGKGQHWAIPLPSGETTSKSSQTMISSFNGILSPILDKKQFPKPMQLESQIHGQKHSTVRG